MTIKVSDESTKFFKKFYHNNIGGIGKVVIFMAERFETTKDAKEFCYDKIQQVRKGNRGCTSEAWQVAILNNLDLGEIDDKISDAEYDVCLSFLAHGELDKESEARQFAIINNYPLDIVEDELNQSKQEGVAKKYQGLIQLINKGYSQFEEQAWEIGLKYNCDLAKLEDAITTNRRYEFNRRVDYIRHGFLDLDGPAKELAEEYNFPLKEVEDAFEEGINNYYKGRVNLIKLGFSNYESEAWQVGLKYNLDLGKLVNAIVKNRELTDK